MKIRTIDELSDRVTEELAWRRKELTIFRSQVINAPSHVQAALLRGAVAMLYAHWEGFVKKAGQYYLSYLASQRLTYRELRPELVALALRRLISDFQGSNRSEIHALLVKRVRDDADTRARIPTSADAVRTRSNLNHEVLVDILCSLGCDYARYSVYQDLIDGELLASRNKIAHGEQDYIRLTDWEDLRKEILFIMEDISNQLVNSALMKTYLISDGARPLDE